MDFEEFCLLSPNRRFFGRMKRGNMFDFRKLGFSFKIAFRGLKITVQEEQSFRIQLIIGVLILFLMFYFPLIALERTVLVLTIVLVLGLELINSQVERVLDFLQPNHNMKIKRIKDLSAAAVLVACLGAVFIALLIFLPYIF